MASISNGPNGRRTVQFVAPGGKRKSVRLGKVSKRIAEEVKVKVEALAAAQAAGLSPDAETARWVASLAPALHDRLAAAGLVPARQAAATPKLQEFLAGYVAARSGGKPSTLAATRTATKRLLAFFGPDRELSSITPGDADDWARWLRENYAGATAGRSVKWARQFFRAAVRKRLIGENPFGDVKAPGMANDARQVFVSREDTAKLLDACPDAEWRLLVALCRYGGLRCPSEPLALKWTDVNWEQGRFRVFSPKTEHHEGKAERWVPIFPELRPYLAEAFEQAPEGAVYVITTHRSSAKNVRTRILRYLGWAGLTPWPRLFQNLRSSRETELAADHPLHVVCAWIGNSAPIAARHYLQVTDVDYERAAKSGAEALQKAVQQPAAPAGTETQKGPQSLVNCGPMREPAICHNSLQGNLLGTEGLEPPTPRAGP